MWHYLYFYVLVKEKDRTEFTGPESYVYAMVQVIHIFNMFFCVILVLGINNFAMNTGLSIVESSHYYRNNLMLFML